LLFGKKQRTKGKKKLLNSTLNPNKSSKKNNDEPNDSFAGLT
jgi:hypothetical protein